MKRILIRLLALSVVSCTSAHQPTTYDSTSGGSSYAADPNNFKVSLVDAPNAELKAVIVDVDHAELRVSRAGRDGRLIVAEGLGPIDLLKLQEGLAVTLGELALPTDTSISQIRLVLKADGHYATKADGSDCELKTPSAQRTGIKLLLRDSIIIEKGFSYSLVADFDAMKSVVVRGNGECLLKPVIKLKSASRISRSEDGGVEEPVGTPDDASQDADDTGFETEHGGNGNPEPPIVDPSTL